MKKHLILNLIFSLLFIQSLFSYPYNFRRLYRAEDDTTIDLISDVHLEPNVDCLPADKILRDYNSLFMELRSCLENDLGVFWESCSLPDSECFMLQTLFEEKKEILKQEIDNLEVKDLVDRICFLIRDFKCHAGMKKNLGIFINDLAYFLNNHNVDIIEADCFRKILRYSRTFLCSHMSHAYSDFTAFFIYKVFAPEALEKFNFVSKQENIDLEVFYSYFSRYKTEALASISKIEFEKFMDNMYEYQKIKTSSYKEKIDDLLDILELRIEKLYNYFVVQLPEYEMLFKMLSSPQKRKILYAGGWHCNEVKKKLVTYHGFVEIINLGAEQGMDNPDYQLKLNLEAKNPTFHRSIDGSTQYFSFEGELDFEVLKRNLLEDPKLSYAKWIEAQRERVAFKHSRSEEYSEEAQDRDEKRARVEG